MIVQVREMPFDTHPDPKYVDVDTRDESTARKVAFRFIKQRREKDYSELINNTHILDISTITSDAAEILLSHISTGAGGMNSDG